MSTFVKFFSLLPVIINLVGLLALLKKKHGTGKNEKIGLISIILGLVYSVIFSVYIWVRASIWF